MEFDATFYAFVGLLLFLALIAYLKVPGMMAKGLDARAEKIQNELAEAKRLREEAQHLLAEYQRKRKDAEAEAASIVAAEILLTAILVACVKMRLVTADRAHLGMLLVLMGMRSHRVQQLRRTDQVKDENLHERVFGSRRDRSRSESPDQLQQALSQIREKGVFAQVAPDGFHRVEFRRVWRQGQQGDAVGHA